MPRGIGYGYGRTGRRRRRRRRQSAAEMAKHAVRIALRSRPRLKTKSSSLTLTPIGTNWQAILLNGIAEGDSLQNRDGSVVFMHSLRLQIELKTPKATDIASMVRYVVVVDKQANGLDITPNSVFEGSNIMTSPMDSNFVPSRFTIIWDHMFSLQEYAGNAAVRTVRTFDKTFSLSRKKVAYFGASNLIASITSGSLWFMAITETATNQPLQLGNAQIRFVSGQN